MIKVAILGSTGSIGTQALDVIAANPEIFKVQVLTAHANHRLLRQQIERFRPEFAVLTDAQAAKEMTQQDLPPEVKFAQGIRHWNRLRRLTGRTSSSMHWSGLPDWRLR